MRDSGEKTRQAESSISSPPGMWELMMIEKRGSKWVVLSMAGEVLGTHDTEREAQVQLAQIELQKALAIIQQRRR